MAKNKRCPLQQECGRKCEYENNEFECEYYASNAFGDNVIPDQEARRLKQEREREEQLYEDALNEIDTYADGGIVWIDINRLHPHPDNPRKDLGDLTELSDSIKAKGVLQNLTVISGHYLSDEEYKKVCEDYREKPSEELRTVMNKRWLNTDYTIVIGHRRTEAARIAGLTKLPCIITEMTPSEQVQTMLLENMQRSDLTVYEQAQGFQLMLDLGDTIESVAEKTGFSKSTVRRRIKMTELDKDVFKQASDKQISLFELDRVAQIKDVKTRNNVLAEYGTNNYENAIKKAMKVQEEKETQAVWRPFLEGKGWKEIKYADTWEYTPCNIPYIEMTTSTEKFSDVEIKEGKNYFFSFYGTTVYLRTDKEIKQDTREISPEEKARREKVEKLKGLAKDAYELRQDFIKIYLPINAEKNLPKIIEWTIKRSNSNGWYGNYDKEFMNACYESKIYTNSSDKYKPYIELLYHCYSSWGDAQTYGYHNWNGDYNSNKHLDLIYEFLTSIGYEMSDEEKSLQDGTHNLFHNEIDESDETDTNVGDKMTDEELYAEVIEDEAPSSDEEAEGDTDKEIISALRAMYGDNDDE